MRRGWPFVALAAGFAATTLLWERAGIRFRADTVDFFAQLLDPPLLSDRLAESLWNLHAQPPLFNLVVGCALKVSPAAPGVPLRVFFLLAGLVTCVALYAAVRALRVPAPVAVLAALAFTATPQFALYEHWCFYPHLALAMLAVAAACFLRAGRGGAFPVAAGFSVLGLLALTRSVYPPLYLALAAGTAIACVPTPQRGPVARAAAPAVVIVALWAAKNLALFGFFGLSSWGGNSLHRMMTEALPGAVVQEMVRRGEISPLSLEWEFSPPETYLKVLGPARGDTGVPALDQTGKTRTRENPVNYNHWVYPLASREYARNAWTMLRAHPDAYFRSVRWTARRYLDPVTDDMFVRPIAYPVRHALAPFERAERGPVARGLVLLVLLWALVRLVTRRGPAEERLFLAFALGTLLWASAAGILLEYGENNRFRWHLSPLVFLLGVMAARDAIRAVRARVRQ